MKVISVELRRVQRRAAHAMGGVGHRTDVRDTLEIDVHAESEGSHLIGRGEAAPLPGYSLDTIAEVEVLRDFRCSLSLDDRLVDAIAARTASLPPSARAAIESALLDLAGQALQRPVWSLLGGAGHALPLSAVLFANDDAIGEESAALLRSGYTTQKRKLGPSQKLASLRRLPRAVTLRLDANRSLTRDQFVALIPSLIELRPSFIEEPVNIDLAAWLNEYDGPLQIAIDESLAARDVSSALAVLERFSPAIAHDKVAAIIVKPGRDGLLGALRLGRAAQGLGVPVIVTHLWEGPRGHLAAAHLAIALGAADSLAQGLAPHALIESDAYLMGLLDSGRLTAPTRPGL